MHKFKFNFKIISTSIVIASIAILIFSQSFIPAQAATGINRQINFQGKLVNNPSATNVTNTTYTVVFTLYDNASGANTALWTETQSVTTTDGIFRVALGSVTPFPANFNFNWSGLYLGMKVNADSEMTPRIQMAAVPFAFNSEKVAGLTVQDTSGNASTSGTLQVGNGKTISFSDNIAFGTGTTGTISLGSSTNTLTLTTSGNTTLALPTSGTLCTTASCLVSDPYWNQLNGSLFPNNSTVDFLVGGQSTTSALFAITGIAAGTPVATLSASTNGNGLVLSASDSTIQSLRNNGLTLGGNTTGDIQFKPGNSSTSLYLASNGNVGIGTTNPLSTLQISGGYGSNALVSLNQLNNGDIFTASSSGLTRFTVGQFGNVFAAGAISSAEHILSTSSASLISAVKGFGGYTNFSGGIGTGGVDSVPSAQRLTSSGNLTNIGSIQAGEILLTGGGTFTNSWSGGDSSFSTVGDINGDGRNDFLDTDGSNIRVYFGRGDGTFDSAVSYAVSGASGIEVGDLNGDGKADVVVTTGNNVSVLLNNGNGTLGGAVSYATGTGANKVAIGDFNNDGKKDLVVTNYNTGSGTTISVLLNNGNGTFAPKQDYTASTGPRDVAIGDLDGDGFSDLVVGYLSGTSSVSIFINNRNGTFANKVDYSAGSTGPSHVAIGDLNNDGIQDIAVTTYYTTSRVSVLINSGQGTFSTRREYTAVAGAGDIAVGDISGDGKNDMVVLDESTNQYTTYINGGSNNFSRTDYTMFNYPYSLKLADFNGDGKLDMALLSGNSSSSRVYLNTANPIFYAQAYSGRIGIGISSTPSATLDVRGSSGTLAVASISGQTSFAALVVDNNGVGDIFTASKSGLALFTVKNNGQLTLGAPYYTATCTLKTDSSGLVTCGTDLQGSGSGGGAFAELAGAIVPLNSTEDFLIGGQATTSALFAITGIAAGTPVATLSASTNGNGLVLSASDSTIQSLRNNGLTLGGNTTGDITINARNGLGTTSFVSDLSQGARSTSVLSITQANNVSNDSTGSLLTLTNADTGSTSFPALAINQVASNGKGITISGITGGTNLSIGTITSGYGIYLSGVNGAPASGFWIGTFISGVGYGADVSTLTSGTGLSLTGSTSGSAAQTGNIIYVAPIRSNISSSITDTGSYLKLSRNVTITSSADYARNGDLAAFSSNCTITLGSCADSSNILSLAQNYTGATGNVLFISNSGKGLAINANSIGNTTAVASISGQTSFAAMVVDNSGVGDIFTASKSGLPIFTVKNNGQLTLGAPYYQTCTLKTVNGLVTCDVDNTGSGGGYSPFQELAGAIVPNNSTADFLIGGQATTSAKFAITGISNLSNQVNASLSGQLIVMANNGWGGNATISGALTIGAFSNGVIQTTSNTALIIGGDTTGNITLSPNNGTAGLVSISGSSLFTTGTGLTTLGGSLTISGTAITLASATTIDSSGAINLGTTNATTLTLGRSTQGITLPGFLTCTLKTDGSGVLQCGTDLQGSGGGAFTELLGAIVPNNSTMDFLIGGQSTTSALFAITGIAAGTPVATLSASTNGNGLVLSASDSTIQSLRNNGLILGGNTTGNITFVPNNTTALTLTSGGTLAVANVSGNTSFAALVVNNNGAGDLITASSSGFTKFTVSSSGAVTLGDLLANDIVLGTSSASLISAYKGFNGYTNFSGGIGTGGTDSITNAQRITNTGNLVNIGSIQSGELLVTNGGMFAAKVDYTTGTDPRGVAIGDLNGDGKADMAVTNYSAVNVSVFINLGDGTFAPKQDYTTGTSPRSVAIGDLNGDGKADMAVANYNSTSVSVFINKGDGTFNAKVDYTAGTNPTGVAIGDLNGDGKADMVVGHSGATTVVSVFINKGDGTFNVKADYTTGAGSFPLSVAIGDLNGDGKADMVVANNGSTSVSAFINTGNGTFSPKQDYATEASPLDVAIGDLNGDGKADMAVVNNGSPSVSAFINTGNGTFSPKADYPTGNNPYGVAIGDLNGDGKADMVVINNYVGSGTTVSVLINQSNPMLFAQAVTGRVGIGISSTPSATFDVRGTGQVDAGILAVASISGTTSFASMVVDNNGVGDIFTASKSGLALFTVKNNGQLTLGAPYYNTCTLKTDSTGLITCGSDLQGGGGGGAFTELAGAIVPLNSTEDFLIGGQATTSAKFAVLGVNTGQTIASVSGNFIVMPQNGWGGQVGIGYNSPGTAALAVNGNVGIGTTNPGEKLTVGDGTANVDLSVGSSTANKMYLSTSGNSAFFAINRKSSNGVFANSSLGASNLGFFSTATGGYIDFNTIDAVNTNPVFRMRVAENGNVGIGTTSPIAPLHVNSGYGSNAALIVNNLNNGDLFTASASGATKFTIANSGDITWAAGTPTITINAAETFTISNGTAADNFVYNTSTNALTLGDGTNGLTFDIDTGITYQGSGRKTKTIHLAPEYPGAVLTASGSGTTNGSMTSDASPSASFQNYYEWSSTQASLQDYTVAVHVELPADFSAWPTNNAITVEFNTATTNAPQNKFDFILFNTSDASPKTPVVMRTANASSVAKEWQTLTITGAALTGGTATLNTPGHEAVIYLKMYAGSPGYVQVGDIELNYLSAF